MTPTYYTPEIEEFHVGFVFEVKNPNPYIPSYLFKEGEEWKKTRFQFNDIVMTTYKGSNVRVKHLDREDIEGEGWEFADSGGLEYFKLNDENRTSLHVFDENKIRIEDDYGVIAATFIVLNLSEFRKLMKQLGIKK